MRYVDIATLKLPDGWLARAENAAAEVAKGADPNDFGDVWREVKDGLANLLSDKCWYCETPIERSDNAVDHFRPKNRVSDAKAPHTGYRWLAFEHTNYRYACTFCNSRRKDIDTAGGKADRFPLFNEEMRLYAPGQLHQERPKLLDPCDMDDWELLGCNLEDGKPCATSQDIEKREKAQTSIEVYHLHYGPTCNHRHAVAVQLMADIGQAKRFFPLSAKDGFMKNEFNEAAKKIKRAISRNAPFSGEMTFLLRGERHSDHPWIQKLLEA